MSAPVERWSEEEWLTLRLGAAWIISALVGRTHLDHDERNAFWDCVTDLALTSDGLTRRLLANMAANRRWLFDELQRDDRPIVSGLNAIVALLDRVDPVDARHIQATLLGIGTRFATLRGPFGRRITVEDEQTLSLIEQLLKTDADTVTDNPLNSPLPI